MKNTQGLAIACDSRDWPFHGAVTVNHVLSLPMDVPPLFLVQVLYETPGLNTHAGAEYFIKAHNQNSYTP